MRSTVAALLLGASIFVAPAQAQDNAPAQQATQGGPADLCRELLAFAEKTAAAPPKGGQAQASAPSSAPQPRTDAKMSGTQGGGSVSGSSSSNTSGQSSAPPTVPATSGAAPEAASSPHATDSASSAQGASQPGAGAPAGSFSLGADVTLQQVRDVAEKGDRQACRDTTQKLRRAGAGLPAELIALAAYEPDPERRK